MDVWILGIVFEEYFAVTEECFRVSFRRAKFVLADRSTERVFRSAREVTLGKDFCRWYILDRVE